MQVFVDRLAGLGTDEETSRGIAQLEILARPMDSDLAKLRECLHNGDEDGFWLTPLLKLPQGQNLVIAAWKVVAVRGRDSVSLTTLQGVKTRVDALPSVAEMQKLLESATGSRLRSSVSCLQNCICSYKQVFSRCSDTFQDTVEVKTLSEPMITIFTNLAEAATDHVKGIFSGALIRMIDDGLGGGTTLTVGRFAAEAKSVLNAFDTQYLFIHDDMEARFYSLQEKRFAMIDALQPVVLELSGVTDDTALDLDNCFDSHVQSFRFFETLPSVDDSMPELTAEGHSKLVDLKAKMCSAAWCSIQTTLNGLISNDAGGMYLAERFRKSMSTGRATGFLDMTGPIATRIVACSLEDAVVRTRKLAVSGYHAAARLHSSGDITFISQDLDNKSEVKLPLHLAMILPFVVVAAQQVAHLKLELTSAATLAAAGKTLLAIKSAVDHIALFSQHLQTASDTYVSLAAGDDEPLTLLTQFKELTLAQIAGAVREAVSAAMVKPVNSLLQAYTEAEKCGLLDYVDKISEITSHESSEVNEILKSPRLKDYRKAWKQFDIARHFPGTEFY